MARNGGPPCYACIRARAGCKSTEGHHPFGRDSAEARKIIVEIPPNWHRVLDARRAKRPAILKRPGNDPLHQIAAVVVTLGEAADALAEYGHLEQWPEWVVALARLFARAASLASNWLLVLAGQLDERLGPAWAENLDMPKWRLKPI